MFLVAGGIVAYAQLRPRTPAPAQVVRQYFADLATGDTTAAMALVDHADNYPASRYPFLSHSALVRSSVRPTDLTIDQTNSTTAGNGASATAISVSYHAGAATVHQTITTISREPTAASAGTPDTAAGSTLLDAPFITLTVGPVGPRPVSVMACPTLPDHRRRSRFRAPSSGKWPATN